MNVEHIEVLVEEPSMEAALRVLLPRMIENLSFECYTHQCKDDLVNKLPGRLRGYASWLPDTWRILIVVDRDDEDCAALKARLERIAANEGLVTRSAARGNPYVVVNRLAIEELEAWYFGDWNAVQAAFPRVPRTIPTNARFRDPDAISGGTWEAFERILQQAGYFKGGLRKIEAARTIAKHMAPDRNESRSFQAFRAAIMEMAAPQAPA
ncbi:MAG: hypothetical protein A3G73_11265 [Rhodospirillales bacterium RIFCSPLOWO2_12_FULL_67_15]|nr:MAG: hypothetical protein A3G73_11265 [Rhodospirillales bacterium RIFCSPLOWO2_12_FULL_67_15]